MDNLGIFKLLTSAFDFYQKNKAKEKEGENSEIKSKQDLLSLLNFNNLKQNNEKTEKQEPVPPQPQKPLQEKMLSTMRNHNEFVARVLNNNKK